MDKKIREIAYSLLIENNFNIYNYIDIESLISKLKRNITLKYMNLWGLPGFTCKHGENYLICIDSSLINTYFRRYKFTLAHELGHIVLGHLDNQYFNHFISANPKMEFEANIFAEELLMPTYGVCQEKMRPWKIKDIYRVSKLAAENKYKYLKSNSFYWNWQQLKNTGLLPENKLVSKRDPTVFEKKAVYIYKHKEISWEEESSVMIVNL